MATTLFPNSIPYPDDQDIANLKPYSQSYYITSFVLDNTYSDLCSMNTSFSASWIESNSSRNNLTNSCFSYFCECSVDSRVCLNLTHSLISNQTFQRDYFVMMNYCLSCNTEEAHAFRKEINGSNTKCSQRFPSLERIQRSMLKHCNGGFLEDKALNSILASALEIYNYDNTTTNTSDDLSGLSPNFNIGIVDWRFFQPDLYYSNKYLKNYSLNIQDHTLHLFESLFLSETVNPVMCWCRNQPYQKFAFQCGDAYDHFFIPFKYIGTPLIVIVLALLALVSSIFYNSLPLIVSKRKKIFHLFQQEIALRSTSQWYLVVWTKIMLEQCFLTDLRAAILFFQTCASIFMVVENVIGFVWNFMFWNSQFDNNELYGCFRALSIFSMSMTFTALLVHWSHVVDLINATATVSKPKRHLSRKNLIILVSIYMFNIIVILIGSIVSGVLRKSTPLFACAAAAMILLPTILIIAFTIYGFRIYWRLKRTQTNFVELRFTRFIILFNISLAIGFGLACVFIPTFIIRWDIYGIFVGLFKNFVIDCSCILFIALITYILCHEGEFKQCYGSCLTQIFLCECSKDHSSGESNTITKIEKQQVSPTRTLHTDSPSVNNTVETNIIATDDSKEVNSSFTTPVSSIAHSKNINGGSEKAQSSV
ncbi:hypothetical protein C9374_012651 [Naegleria lovaniensis]|uniref:Uncharacterized protein n=1 Tax=Naegleria lovaniensis TaxID=51637 RepID=A0AA88GXJ1_NAELO|nr:uncharacterized protein C9374_012651 [Naegleria lovaniensis]KAG2392399.1 hypothetical protein C9374_012651 [Naegleria lovaniensis]